MQYVDPSSVAYDPGSQLWQVTLLVAPTAVENLPTPHLLQVLVAPRLYVPASQSVCPVAPSVMFQLEAAMHSRFVGWQSGLHLLRAKTLRVKRQCTPDSWGGSQGSIFCKPKRQLV